MEIINSFKDNMKLWLHLLAVCFTIAALDGVFGWGLADGFYTLVGIVMVVSLVKLEIMAYKK